MGSLALSHCLSFPKLKPNKTFSKLLPNVIFLTWNILQHKENKFYSNGKPRTAFSSHYTPRPQAPLQTLIHRSALNTLARDRFPETWRRNFHTHDIPTRVISFFSLYTYLSIPLPRLLRFYCPRA